MDNTLRTKMVSLTEMSDPKCWIWDHPLLAERALKIANIKATNAAGVVKAIEALREAATMSGVRLRDVNRKISTSPEKNCLIVTKNKGFWAGHMRDSSVVFVDSGKRPYSFNTRKSNPWDVSEIYTGKASVIWRAQFYNESIAELKLTWRAQQ